MKPIGIQLSLGGEREVESGLRRVGGAMDSVGTAASGLARAVGGVAGAFAGVVSIREFVQAADAVTSLQNQLKLATGSAQAAGTAYNELFQIAQRSRTGFIELGQTFASISTAAADMGVSQQRLLKVTEAIGNAVTISGTGAQAAQAALQQLGQGLASGTLRGEELNSVMEQTPRLAKALADGLGVTRGELRALGQQGAITAEQVIKALESQSSVLQGEVKDATLTVGQAFTQLTNSATRAVGDFDRATGATATLAGTISSLAGAVDTLGGVIRNNEGAFKVLGGTLAGAAVVAGAAGIVKSIGLIGGAVAALGAVLLANPAVLALLGLSAAVGGGVALISAQSKTADGISQAIERLRTENERSEAALARAVAGGRLAGADNIAKTIDARKDQIARLRAELDSLQPSSAGAGGGRGSVNPQTVGAAAAQQAAGEKELIAIRQKLYGVDKDYLPTLDKLHAQYTSGAISIDEYQKLVGKLAEANFKKEKTDPGRGLKSEESAYQNLIATINTKIAQEREELAGAGALTESQRIRIKLDQDLAAGRVKLSAQNERAVRLALEELAASEASALAAKTLAKANLDAAASREKYLTSLSSGLDKIQADIAAQIEATERMGLSKEAIAELDAAKLEMLATDLELQAIKAMDRNLDQQTYDALKKQAAAYRELGIAKKGGAAKEAALDLEKANAEAAKKAQEDWERAAEQINSSLTDALLRGFESGKDFAKNMRDTIVNMFKTMVLRPVVSAIVSPVAGAITGALGLSTAAQAGQGVNGVSTAISGASLLGRLGAFGGGMSAGFGGLMGSLGLSATGSTLGGAMSAGSIALGSGNILGGLGTFAGALGPIALGIGLLSSAFSRKLKDQGIQGTLGGEAGFEGQQYRFYEGGLFRSDKTTYSAIDPELARVLAGGFSAVQDQVTDFAEALSLPTDRIKGFTTDIKVSFKGLDEAGIQKALQDALATGSNRLAQQVLGTLTTTTREVTETLAGGMGDWGDGTMQTVTRTIEETTYAASEYAREGEKAIDTLTRLATSVTAVNGWFERLGLSLYEASLRGADAASSLADLFGGLENFSAAASSYYEAYYSEAERAAQVTREVAEGLAELGISMPASREGFRALVEAQDLSTEAGRATYAALLQLAPAFASIAQSADQVRADAQAYALTGLQRAVDAQKRLLQAQQDAAEEAVSSLSGVFDLLRSNVRELYDEVASTAAMQAAQGSAFIANALSVARSTGYMPEQDQLAEAIAAARGGIDATQYATQFEADRARLVLAGQLSELETMAGEQLGTAERTLRELQGQSEQLDSTLQYWRDQLELSQAGVDATLSVADAVAALQALMFPEDTVTDAAPGGAPTFSSGPSGGGGSGGGGAAPDRKTEILGFVGDAYKDTSVLDDLRGFAITAEIKGWTQADIAAAYGYSLEDIEKVFSGAGIPKFAVGTNYVPRDMLAQIHEGEAIIPKAYNPWAGGSQSVAAGSNAELIAELRALRSEVAQLRATSAATASYTAQLADQIDNVSGGGNAVRMEAVA